MSNMLAEFWKQKVRPTFQLLRRHRGHIGLALFLAIIFAFIAAWIIRENERVYEARVLNAIQNAVARVVALDKQMQPTAQGSGVFISSDGLLITSYHLVKGQFGAIEARLESGAFYKLKEFKGVDS